MMAEEKMVKVVALDRGQTPEGQWVKEGDEFEVPESMVSKKWHKRLDGAADTEEVVVKKRATKEKEPEAKPAELPAYAKPASSE